MARYGWRVVALVLLVLLAVASLSAALIPTDASAAPLDSRHVDVATLEGAVDPLTAQYLTRAIDAADKDGAEALIIQMDTPGGLDSSMRKIISKMLASPVPVVVYVSPSGARAASAGVFITMASHVAAMAPSTNIGSAHPVSGEGAGHRRRHGRQGHQRRRRLHPHDGREAWAQRRLGRGCGAQERQHRREGSRCDRKWSSSSRLTCATCSDKLDGRS